MKIAIKDARSLNALLIKKGYSKADLAKQIQISQPMTVQITNGDRYPSPRTAKRICDALEVNFDDIFVIEETTPKASSE